MSGGDPESSQNESPLPTESREGELADDTREMTDRDEASGSGALREDEKPVRPVGQCLRTEAELVGQRIKAKLEGRQSQMETKG